MGIALGPELLDRFFVNVVQLREAGATALALHVHDLVQISLRDRLNQRDCLAGIFADHGYGDDFGAFLKIDLELFCKPSERLGLFADHLQILHVLALEGGTENEIVLNPGGLSSLVGEELAAAFGGIGITND